MTAMFNEDECGTAHAEEECLWLFAYGTLQPGQALYPYWLKEATLWTVWPATTKGQLYHVPGASDANPVYPMGKLGQEGTIQGTLIGVDPTHRRVAGVRSMERGAGYEERTVEVRYGGHTMEALAFHYIYGTGPLIPDGDWVRVVRQYNVAAEALREQILNEMRF